MDFIKAGFESLPTAINEEILRLLFIGLGFKVDIYRNLTASEMISVAREYGKMNHTGAFVFVVLSYGELQSTSVYGTDGEDIQVLSKLEKYFKEDRCPSLKRVPKIFLYDTCTCTCKTSSRGGSLHKKALDHHSYGQFTKPLQQHAADSTFIFTCSLRQEIVNPYHGSKFTKSLKAAIDEADDENGSFGMAILSYVMKNFQSECIEFKHGLTERYLIKR